MKLILIFLSCIAATLAAPPTWTPEMAALYSEASLQIRQAKSNGLLNLQSCDLSKLNITDYLSTIPDAPVMKGPGNDKLVQVTLGRGIQNYTCDNDKPETKPKAIGAVANLYNVSCIAVNYPSILSLLSPFAVQYNTTLDSKGKLMWLNIERSGHHFFAGTSPLFDLNDSKDNKLGIIVGDAANINQKENAPKSAVKGQAIAVNGLNGAVPWLKLDHKDGTTNGLSQVYRVVTAGGMAPANCSGQPVAPAVISVQYAAQYWFFDSA